MPRYKVECRLGQSIVDAIDEDNADTKSFGFGSMVIHRTDDFREKMREINKRKYTYE